MDKFLCDYGNLLATVDSWFDRCLTVAPSHITCHRGCAGCCRGLFDITLLDACYLKSGFDHLPAATRAEVLIRADVRLKELQRQWPGFTAPYILNLRPDGDWEELMPEEDETHCPLLAENGTCLVYDHRPMTCRLHGIPLIDLSGEMMYDLPGWWREHGETVRAAMCLNLSPTHA